MGEKIIIIKKNFIKKMPTIPIQEIEIIKKKVKHNIIFRDEKKEEIVEIKGFYYQSRKTNETIIKLLIPEIMKEQINNSEYILILDISDSMGN